MEQKFQISLVCDQQVSSYWSSLVATPQILKSKPNWKSISGVPASCCRCCPNSALERVNQALTVRIGMLFHSSINAFLSCARVAGGFRRFLTLLSSSSHMCSIGVKSGLYGGHASGAMLLFARKSWQTRATCGQALSCCRIRLRCCTSGTATGRKISSLYLTAVILPRLFPMRQWRRVLFTDESRFTLYRADGRRRVYRRRGERFADAFVVERDRFGGGSVMVWGGIAHGIKSQLIIVAGNMTAVRYRDEILRPVVNTHAVKNC